MGCIVILFVIALWAAISAGLGFVAAWVLSYFGLIVPWYVCSVAIWLIGMILKPSVTVRR